MKLNEVLGNAYKEGMTLDEVISALNEIPNPASEIEKLRNAVSKANSQAADYKKRLAEKQTDDEKAAQQNADAVAELERKLEELTKSNAELVREKTLADYKAEFSKLGFSSESAGKAAVYLADGNMTELFKCAASFLEEHNKAYKAELLKTTPTPPGADGNGGADSEGVAFAKKLAQSKADANDASKNAMSAFH